MAIIAVYGSLCRGFFNFNKYLAGRTMEIRPGKTKGQLFHMPRRGYPALLDGNDDIYCEIMTLTGDVKALLSELDKMENASTPPHPNDEYHRLLRDVVDIQTGEHFSLSMYMFNIANPQAKDEPMIYISHGNWPRYMRENNKI